MLFVCASVQDNSNLYMVLEYVAGGEMFSHLRNVGNYRQVLSMSELAQAALFCVLIFTIVTSSEYSKSIAVFLPERDYVTFGFLLSQIRLSVVCRLSVTLVHPTQAVEPFGKIFSPLCTLAIL